jgi:hypothetical protein
MVYFITENYLRANGIIGANVDVNDYKGVTEFSAKAFIKPMLGTHFFTDLLTKYNAQTLSTDETTLVDMMQKAIAFRIKAQAVLELSYQLTNKGLMRQSDDNATSADKGEVAWLYDHNISHVKMFESDIKEYLKLNKSLFPEFISDLNTDSNIKPFCCNRNKDDFNEGVGFLFV